MERLRLLSELAAELALFTEDYEALLALCARRLSERFGDLCIIRLVSGDGRFLEPSVAVYASDPKVTEAAWKVTGTREPIEATAVIGQVIASGKPALVPRMVDVDALAHSSEERRAFASSLGITGLVVAPLVSRGKTIGIVSLTRRGGTPFDEGDLQLLQDIAAHAALAIETSRTHRALVESSRAHQLLFEASPVPVFVYDTETLVPLAVNAAALELFAVSRQDFLRRDLCHLVDLDSASAKQRLVAAGGRDMSGTRAYRCGDGQSIVAEYTSRALEFAGRPARIVSLKDVTARTEADSTRALLAAIVESANDAVVSCTLGGTVLTWNDAARRLFGYPAHEMIGQPFSCLVPDDCADDDGLAIARVARGEHVPPWETTRRRRDGSIVHVAVSLAPIRTASGEVVALARTARDRTAEREASAALARTEMHLRQAQKMEEIGRLAGGVAHDFNNMLSVILSYASVMVDELEPGATWRDEALEILGAATRAAELTRQLLVFSRQHVVEPRVIDLNTLVEGMQKMLTRLLSEDVDLRFEPTRVGSIRVDPSSVDQVVLNLVVNARDAMPDGGTVTLATREVAIEGRTYVALDVTDTGVGMDDATQARVFEPFFTTKPLGKGTGLGLATVFGIAQQAGGGVLVSSAPRRGATFTVYFPRAAPVHASIAPKPESRAICDATILVVEDEPRVLAAASKILAQVGFRVLTASCPEDALGICAQRDRTIDLLLTDVVMPQMNGPVLAARVRAKRPETKAICMSGYTDAPAREAVATSGLPFLQKPFTPQSLVDKVNEVLATSRARRQKPMSRTM